MDFSEQWVDTCSTVAKCVKSNDLKSLRKLIREGKAVDCCDNRNWRPIHEASVLSKYPNSHLLVEELLKHEDTDPNWRTHEGESPILLTCRHNNEENAYKIVSLLLKYKADPNITDNEEESPLLAAARNGLTLVGQLLATQESVDVNKADLGGWTALHESATRGSIALITTLINSGAKLEAKDECGMTVIFTAAQHGRLDCLKILVEEVLKQGLNDLLNEGANDGATPLMIAAQQGFTDCIAFLINSGADPDKTANDGVNALHLAAEFGHHKTIELLLKHINVKAIEDCLLPEMRLQIRNPLHLAINSERYKCLKVMLKSGFNKESVDYMFEQKFSLAMPSPKYITALAFAVSLNNTKAVKICLKYGSNPNSYHPNILSPIHCIFSVFDFDYERGDENYRALEILTHNKVDVNYCRTIEEPNELLHAIFIPTYLQLLLSYGFDVKTCFKEGYISRFLAMSFHTVTLHWYHNVLPVVIKIIERNCIVRDHFSALSHHIESIFKLRFSIYDYNPSVWKPVMDLFESPHSLKECARFAVRRNVYTFSKQNHLSFPDVITSLDLPNSLQDYLLFKGFSVQPVII